MAKREFQSGLTLENIYTSFEPSANQIEHENEDDDEDEREGRCAPG
jgi:hypothetical protein